MEVRRGVRPESFIGTITMGLESATESMNRLHLLCRLKLQRKPGAQMGLYTA